MRGGPNPMSPEELMRFLSQTPILPLDGASPIELTPPCFRHANNHDHTASDSVAPAPHCSGALGRVKTALRYAPALRGLDPPNALPES